MARRRSGRRLDDILLAAALGVVRLVLVGLARELVLVLDGALLVVLDGRLLVVRQPLLLLDGRLLRVGRLMPLLLLLNW